MKTSVFCLAVLLCYNSFVKGNVEGSAKGNFTATIEEAPWTVIIEEGYQQMNVGSIVGPNLVLTSTRYIEKKGPSNFVVRAGAIRPMKNGTTHKITNVVTHPKAIGDGYYGYDVGVITVDPPFQLDETRQIIKLNLNAQLNEFEEDAKVYYYDEDYLSVTQLMVKDVDWCDRAWPPGYGMKACAISAIRGDGPCDYDLGAPIVGSDGRAIGVLGVYTFCYKLDYWPLTYTNLTDINVAAFLKENVPDV